MCFKALQMTQKTRKLAIRLVSAVLASTMAVTSMPANAGLKEAVRGMYMSSVTDPQAVSTLRANGFYGGQVSVRPITQNFTVIQFSRPKIDAGCGGIDAFFGSFSFINGEQFQQLIRSIIAVAPAFALRAAIKGMCDSCDAILSELEAAIREINAMAQNTCAIANAMFDKDSSDREALSTRWHNVMTHASNAWSQTSDALAGRAKASATTQKEQAKAIATGDNAPVKMTGNIVFQAFKNNDQHANVLRGYMSDAQATMLLLSLYGTYVFPSADSDLNPSRASEPCGTGSSELRCLNSIPYAAPTITIDELLEPKTATGSTGLEVWSCSDISTSCIKLSKSSLTHAEWPGVAAMVNRALFGTEDVTTISSILPGSIVHSALYGGGSGMTPEAQAIARVMPGNILHMVKEANRAGGAGFATTIALKYARGVTIHLRFQLANSIRQVMSRTLNDTRDQSALHQIDLLRSRAAAVEQQTAPYLKAAVEYDTSGEIAKMVSDIDRLQQMNDGGQRQ